MKEENPINEHHEHFYQEPTPDTFSFTDGVKTVTLSSINFDVNHLAKIAKEFVPINTSTKKDVSYT